MGTLATYARQHAANPTPAEARLLEWLMRGAKRRSLWAFQVVIHPYIVDFVCERAKMVVELDGGYHFTDEQRAKDTARTLGLMAMGYDVVRFQNSQIHQADIAELVEGIQRSADSRIAQRDRLAGRGVTTVQGIRQAREDEARKLVDEIGVRGEDGILRISPTAKIKDPYAPKPRKAWKPPRRRKLFR